MYISYASFFNVCDNSSWILDTGASHHFYDDSCKYTLLSNEHMQDTVKDISFPIEGRGEIKL